MKNNYLFLMILLIFIFEVKAQDPFTDPRDGTIYNTVTIGNQIWLAENLKYLPDVVGPNTFSNTSPYYYVYGYDGTDVMNAKSSANFSTYGVLYNWTAAMAGSAASDLNPSGVQGICPIGWHLPSDFEWLYLAFYLVGDSLAGGKMKEAGTLHWLAPNTNATNESGFTALPGGFCSDVGTFYDLSRNSIWWSTSEFNSTRAYCRNILYNYGKLNRFDTQKTSGLSVRCIKNSNNSLDDFDNKSELIVYPNPAQNVVNIYNPYNQKAKIMIFDTNGKCLNEFDLINSLAEIDISHLPNGIYILQVKESNRIYRTKLIIANY